MADLVAVVSLLNLGLLLFLQAVLGVDNLLHISIKSQRARPTSGRGCGASASGQRSSSS